MKSFLVFIVFVAAHVSEGFVIQARASQFALKGIQSTESCSASRLFMSEGDDENSKQSLIKQDAVTPVGDKSSLSSESETQYPLDIPSPILLATSMLLAISSVGSLFQMMDTTSATAISAAIALIGLPLCLFFFYAAITKAQAETEEDDKAFLKDQRGVRNSNDFFN